MDRKTKVARSENDKPQNGEDKNKETALDKLRQMEWKRNKQDTWHLARSSTRGVDGVHEKKKYNRDEDNYFEGTSGQKNRRNRKQSEGAAQPSHPPGLPGFNAVSGPSGPPPVNAWAQKKGSALFSKPDEVDEEDEMLKLVLEESLKTAEEDQKRALERIRMSNIEVEQQLKQLTPAERGWEDTTDQSASSAVAFTRAVDVPQPKAPNREIINKSESAVDPNIPSKEEWEDEVSDYSASPEQPRQPPEKELHFVDTDSVDDSPPERKRSLRSRSKRPSSSDTQDRPHSRNRDSPQLQNEFQQKNKTTHVSSPRNYEFEETQPGREYLPPVNTGIAASKTTYCNSLPKYENNKNTIVPEKDNNVASVRDLSASPNLTFGDTQDLLEKIRSDYTYKTPTVPDSYLLDTSAYQLKQGSETAKPSFSDSIDETDIMLHNFLRHDPPSGNNAQYLPADNTDITKRDVSIPFGLHNDDSSSSVSDSSVQNASPYGSYEKQVHYGLPGMQQNSQYPYGFPSTQNLQIPNLVSPMGVSGVPPGYAAPRGIVPQNPQMPQYCLPNSNMMMHPSLDPQAQLLSLLHYQTLIAGIQKDQHRVMPQPPMMPMQQQPLMPTQTQPMSIPTHPAAEAQPARKSKEEIILDYQRTLQTLNKLQLELSQVQAPATPVYGGYAPPPTGQHMVGLYGVPMMPQQGSPSPSQLSPNVEQQRLAAAPSRDPTPEPAVGRGRGRLV